jgi:hypothetical protein
MEGPHSNGTPSTPRSLVRAADRNGNNENNRISATCPNPHRMTVHPHYGTDSNERAAFRPVVFADTFQETLCIMRPPNSKAWD